MVEKFYKPIERIETASARLDFNIFKRKSDARTPSGLILSYAQKAKKEGNMNTALFLQELYKKVWALETQEKAVLKSWKKKSGVHYVVHPDRVIATRYKRDEPGETPHEKNIEMSNNEINDVIHSINQLNKGQNIKTSAIAELTYGKNWRAVFSTRGQHTKLVEILNYLEYCGVTHYYRRGETRVLKDIREIQEVLKK
jgi:hypothetical protein